MKKISYILFFLGVILFFLIENYSALQKNIYERFVKKTILEIKNEIASKKSSTLALAITMSECKRLHDFLQRTSDPPSCVPDLLDRYRKFTDYKNIEIEILDANKRVLYRSWNDLKGDIEPIKIDKPYQSDYLYNNLGFFIYSLSSIKEVNKTLGYLMVLSHFNSIRKDLERLGVGMVVVLKDALHGYRIVDSTEKLDSPLIKKVLTSKKYFIDNGKVLSYYPLRDRLQHVVGFVIFFAPKSFVLSRFFSKEILYRIVLLFALIVLAIFTMVWLYKREYAKKLKEQASFFHEIFDTLQEMVIVTNGSKLLYANKKFFDYFDDYKTLDDFLAQHECICDFFVPEEGFLTATVDGKLWTEYLIANEGKTFHVKLRYKDQTYIFNVKAQRIAEEEYSVIFVDITQEYLHAKQLENMAMRDPLTGVFNRYMFEKLAQEKLQETMLLGQTLLFVMIDIDHFKQINDTYGHAKGDQVLQEISRLIMRHFRTSDPVIRVGGEEFLVIVQTKNIERILEILEDLRYDVQRHHFDAIDRRITISIGVAKYHEGDSIDDLYERADQALYESKSTGRNKITYKG